MNELINGNAIKMTSIEIAELVGSRPDNVKISIERLAKSGVIQLPALQVFEKINNLGIGPGGLGGRVTAFAVNIETYPTHIAGLPVAVNICCHVNRHVIREV